MPRARASSQFSRSSARQPEVTWIAGGWMDAGAVLTRKRSPSGETAYCNRYALATTGTHVWKSDVGSPVSNVERSKTGTAGSQKSGDLIGTEASACGEWHRKVTRL